MPFIRDAADGTNPVFYSCLRVVNSFKTLRLFLWITFPKNQNYPPINSILLF